MDCFVSFFGLSFFLELRLFRFGAVGRGGFGLGFAWLDGCAWM